MRDSQISEYQINALIERIANFTVGIAVETNTGVGTGTLISYGGHHFVLTAEHVIAGVKENDIRFWCRPPAAIVEKAAKDMQLSDVGRLTAGVNFPIELIGTIPEADLAVLRLAPDFRLPPPCEFYELSNSHHFAKWPVDDLDGLSMIYFGFPSDNSRPLGTVGNREFCFLGCTSGLCHYDRVQNETRWPPLHSDSQLTKEKDFLLRYNTAGEGIGPRGFSGSGIWIGADDPSRAVWSADPLLIGVLHTHLKGISLLAAAKIPFVLKLCHDAAKAPRHS